jgi:hypothetical protein
LKSIVYPTGPPLASLGVFFGSFVSKN